MANEKRLIDANNLKVIIQEAMMKSDFQLFIDVMQKVCDILDNSLTIDAVEVVRCKDCRYCHSDEFGLWCFNDYENDLQPDDFCSYGERKDNERKTD